MVRTGITYVDAYVFFAKRQRKVIGKPIEPCNFLTKKVFPKIKVSAGIQQTVDFFGSGVQPRRFRKEL